MYNKPKVLWKMNEIFDTNPLYVSATNSDCLQSLINI